MAGVRGSKLLCGKMLSLPTPSRIHGKIAPHPHMTLCRKNIYPPPPLQSILLDIEFFEYNE